MNCNTYQVQNKNIIFDNKIISFIIEICINIKLNGINALHNYKTIYN